MEFPICRLKVKELKAIAKEMGLAHKGLKKCQLILLLERNGANQEEPDELDISAFEKEESELEFPDVEIIRPQKKQLRFGETKLDFIPESKTKGRKSSGTRTTRTLTEEEIKTFTPKRLRKNIIKLEEAIPQDFPQKNVKLRTNIIKLEEAIPKDFLQKNVRPISRKDREAEEELEFFDVEIEKPKPQLKLKKNDTMERFNQLYQLEKKQLLDIIWKMMDDRGMKKTEGHTRYRQSINSMGEPFLEKITTNTHTKLKLKSFRIIEIIFEILKLEGYDIGYSEYGETIGGINIEELDKDNPHKKIKYKPKQQPQSKPKQNKPTESQIKKAVEEEYEKVKKQIKENPEDYDDIMDYYVESWKIYENIKNEDYDEFVKDVNKNIIEYEKVKYIFSKKDTLLPKQKKQLKQQQQTKQQQPVNKMKQIKIKDKKEFDKKRARSNPSFKYIYDMLNDDGVYDTTDDRASYVVESLKEYGIIG